MIAAIVVVAVIVASGCGVLIYAVGTISQRAEREAEESYRKLMEQQEIEQAMERMTRL
jgi:divalent metal cation (Fe/Co/Zn/Cd) transporter